MLESIVLRNEVPLRYVLISGVGIGLAIVAVVIARYRQRAEPKDRSDHVAPNVLARINTEYRDIQ
jgi:hypothetical protein